MLFERMAMTKCCITGLRAPLASPVPLAPRHHRRACARCLATVPHRTVRMLVAAQGILHNLPRPTFT